MSAATQWRTTHRHMSKSDRQILISGGGPVGLLCAWLLGRKGLPVRLFDENSDLIARVTFWNLHDGESWLNDFPWHRVNYPLLFDRHRRPKPAFDAVYATLQTKRTAHAPVERRDPNSR